MSVIKPEIDALLEKTEQNPFLLCAVASKRACDINNMIHGQHVRVLSSMQIDEITTSISGHDTTSIAMQELSEDKLGYVKEDFDEAIKNTNAPRVAE